MFSLFTNSRIWSCWLLFALWGTFGFAQDRTVGLFASEPGTFPGYTLYGPLLTPNHYLLDNCGQIVHSWETDKRLGNSVYLLEDGRLLKTAQSDDVASGITGAGGGESVEILSWEGDLLWEFNPTNDSLRLHHDIELMPNGNILMIVWEEISYADAIAAGRDPALLPEEKLWPEAIWEIDPDGDNGGQIVWEWHLWDHIVQDRDPSKPNYGNPADHPELWDLNFVNDFIEPVGEADWIHFNSIQYNAELDQIVLSAQRLSEIYIIDHSTTTAEAASHSGGRSGMGGDILYRWGNPQAYGRGSDADQQLFGQHDAHWIADGLEGAGNILIFNNGNANRPWSSIEEISAPVNPDGTYSIDSAQAFAPAAAFWSYTAPSPTDFYSWFISGVQRLPNGNTFICAGAQGTFFEIDRNGNEVWRYVNPETNTGILAQGDTIPQLPFGPANLVFRSKKYPRDYAAFGGRELSQKGQLELNPLPDNCRAEVTFPVSALIYPNPSSDILNVELDNVFGNFAALRIYDLTGKLIWEDQSPGDLNQIEVSNWHPGLYLLRIGEYDWKRIVIHR